MMSVEKWANSARQEKYRQDTEHQHAIDAMQALFEDKIDTDSAVDTIASLYEPLLKRNLKPSPVATLWDIICHAARALGGDEKIARRQVEMVNSISKLPDVVDHHDKAVTPAWSSAGVYWKDLPELAMMFGEYALNIEPLDELEDEADWHAQAVPLLNAATFGAVYLAIGRQPIGMPFHAEVSLMHGIEVPCQTLEQQRRTMIYVPPAATWLLLAGKNIYELCKIDHDRQDGAPGSTPEGDEWLWGKGRGYSLGRWAFWKKRFGEIAITKELKSDVMDVAARAASEMDKFERKILDT